MGRRTGTSGVHAALRARSIARAIKRALSGPFNSGGSGRPPGVSLPIAASLAVAIGLLLAPATSLAVPGMLYGIEQNGGMSDANMRTQNLDHMVGLHAQLLRMQLRFDEVATCDPTMAGAPASSFANPCYNWSTYDGVATDAHQRGLSVIFSVMGVPKWVFGKDYGYTGTTDAEFRKLNAAYSNFVYAAASRYSGRAGIPRVSYWTIWNEPSGAYFWSPQTVNGVLIAPRRYALLYNAAARRLKAADSTLLVAPGPTTPASTTKPADFIRAMLPTLALQKPPMDAWAHNAYTHSKTAWEAPLASTMKLPSIGLGNISDLSRLLDSAPVTRGLPLWITEFGYETKPDAAGVTLEQQSDWLAEGSYVAWNHPRIQLMIWYGLFDDGSPDNPTGFQSGLFAALNGCGQMWCPKTSSSMFTHPLWISSHSVAKGQTVTIWAQGRAVPARTKIYVWRGTQWQTFSNTPQPDGSIYLTWAIAGDTWFVSCDTSCGPIVKVTAR
jgi:hypothetical protein